ncbi:uncharacterized protein [Clytia hemisphaerica]
MRAKVVCVFSDTMKTFWSILAILGFFIATCFSHMLKLNECGNYDGIFSKIKYDQRLIGDILNVIGAITLRGCLTKCLYHPICLSVNYRRANSTCELLGVAIQVYNPTKNDTLISDAGWNHFETDYTIKQLGRRCTANNPSCSEYEICEDICGAPGYQCVKRTLRHTIAEYSAVSELAGHEAIYAFDGNEYRIYHSQGSTDGNFWIKATFGKRVFITAVEVVNRLIHLGQVYENRNDNIDLRTILHEGDETIDNVFGNTGDLGERIIIPCNRLADELLAYQSKEVTIGIIQIGEIWVYGKVPFE